jgi:DNA (cytosine-5)-methyltransferase 1
MECANYINNILQPKITEKSVVLDLFAGCGGLSLGFEAAGYKTIGYEMDIAATETYNQNLGGNCFAVKLDLNFEYPKADIVIGGPPCQPFSVGGNQKGISDIRNGFPIFIDAITQLKPRLFMFENVRGLLYANKWYFELVIEELRKLGYIIEYQILNAVNYGVPQNRERLFVVGHRAKYSFPKKHQKTVTVGEAIGDTMFTAPPDAKYLNSSMDKYVANYEKASCCIHPRDLYANKPARTLTCRNLAGATGDMQRVRLEDGRRRRLLHSEAARLQTFPDWYVFIGNETQRYNQIGNAVPPLLAYQMAEAVKMCFNMGELYTSKEVIEKNIAPNRELSLF